ncbi:unnamed protein product [Allacma fusca]|uniref:CCHC-type domain-containing protein n=1 Tax=Allacma fusca TaxID=39272 RepID=A0A8J2Q681_9HEXA|nr:unnamed protein product [Allacma fusca]
MDWVKFKLPFPLYQQGADEKSLVFLKRIQESLQSSTSMGKEDAVFWFLVGVRDDISNKIPFNPSKSMWIEPDELERQLDEIDNGEILSGPYRLNRFQNCFNFFICFNCGNWGHKSLKCKKEKPMNINKATKRKISELYSFEHQPEKRTRSSDMTDRREDSGEDHVRPKAR